MCSAEQSLLIQEEVSTLIEKGAVTQVHNPQPQVSFYSTLFLVPKKGEASNKSQEAERVGDTSALQDERDGDTQRTTENGQLDGEGRLIRCLLHNPNTPQSPTIPEIHGGTKALPVYMLAIQPALCPMGFHQGDEASSNLPSQYGSVHDSVHTQYTTDG